MITTLESLPRDRKTPRRLAAAILAPTVLVACATAPPPLDPQLVPIAGRADAIAANADSYQKVDARLVKGGETSAFATYFSGRDPVLIDEAFGTPAGASARRSYYYEGGALFYAQEDGTFPSSGGTDVVESQLFFDASGRLTGSRKVVNNKLVPVDAAEAGRVAAHAAALRAQAVRVRGPAYKIGFDLASLNALGLAGPPLRALVYEFCIPSDRAEQVQGIDPTVTIHTSPGRIGCGRSQSRGVGHTHQPAYRAILIELAGLSYVEAIEETRPE